jgi:hypothetical protein
MNGMEDTDFERRGVWNVDSILVSKKAIFIESVVRVQSEVVTIFEVEK